MLILSKNDWDTQKRKQERDTKAPFFSNANEKCWLNSGQQKKQMYWSKVVQSLLACFSPYSVRNIHNQILTFSFFRRRNKNHFKQNHQQQETFQLQHGTPNMLMKILLTQTLIELRPVHQEGSRSFFMAGTGGHRRVLCWILISLWPRWWSPHPELLH